MKIALDVNKRCRDRIPSEAFTARAAADR